MTPRRLVNVFWTGSRTYFTASLFFPQDTFADVTRLYAFVRIADDCVDQVPADSQALADLESRFHEAIGGRATGDTVVDEFGKLAVQKGFETEWIEAFFAAMRSDVQPVRMATVQDAITYMYGSAEVIGLMMARILGLPRAADYSARLLGRAMQYANFLRDVAEDHTLGRQYVPQEIVERYGLSDVSPRAASSDPEAFSALMRGEVERYRQWQAMAAEGYRYIPPRLRVPVKTAADMYAWTADEVAREPMVVWRQKVKPSVGRIGWCAVMNSVRAGGGWLLPGEVGCPARETVRRSR